MISKNSIKTLLAASALALMAGGASAATCTFGVEGVGDVWASTACVGSLPGNDSPAAVAGFFGEPAWTLDSKAEFDDDDASFGYSPAGLLTVTGTIFKDDDDAEEYIGGTWSVSSWAGVGSAMLVIKGSNNFAAYLLDLTKGFSGGWTVKGLPFAGNSGAPPAISHVSLYTVPAAIPLPAAGFLLIGALGGLAALRRRRRSA